MTALLALTFCDVLYDSFCHHYLQQSMFFSTLVLVADQMSSNTVEVSVAYLKEMNNFLPVSPHALPEAKL